MTLLVPFFLAHQPFRLRPSDGHLGSADVSPAALDTDYFDSNSGKERFLQVAERCYRPALRLVLDLVTRWASQPKPFRLAFGLSGTFLDQAALYSPDLLELWKALAETGQVEFTGETYYHSLSSLFDDARLEFRAQTILHREAIQRHFGQTPSVFRNTGMLYNDSISRAAQELGFNGIMTEGVDWLMAGWRSPDFVYEGPSGLPVLLRNYRLSDDIGFRFAEKQWPGYPLTAQKFAGWLATTANPVILLAMDFETLGEYLPADTGIFEFLAGLPEQVAEYPHLEWATPAEAISRLPIAGRIDVPVYSTISWADRERDTSAWLGNELQQFCYEEIKRMEPMIRATGRPEFVEAWRKMQASDHLYAISDRLRVGGGGRPPAAGAAVEAFQRLHTAVYDLKRRAAQST